MRKPKKVLLAAAATLPLIAVAACGGPAKTTQSPSDSPDASDANAGKVSLTIASSIGASDLAVFEDMLAEFNSQHPDIEVTNRTVDAETLQAEPPQLVAAGDPYDLVLTNESTITPFAALGALAPWVC